MTPSHAELVELVERWKEDAKLLEQPPRVNDDHVVVAGALTRCADELSALLSRETGAVVWPRDYWPDDLRLARDRLLSSDQFAPDWERLVAFRDACLNHTHPAPAQDATAPAGKGEREEAAAAIALVFNLAQQYSRAPTTLKTKETCDAHKRNGRLLFLVGNLALRSLALRQPDGVTEEQLVLACSAYNAHSRHTRLADPEAMRAALAVGRE